MKKTSQTESKSIQAWNFTTTHSSINVENIINLSLYSLSSPLTFSLCSLHKAGQVNAGKTPL